MTPQSTLIHAAELLEKAASEIWDESAQPVRYWKSLAEAEEFGDLIRTANQLRDMAEKEGV